MATPTDTEVFAQPRPLIGGPLVLWTIGLVAFPFRFAFAVYESYFPLFGLRPSEVTIGRAFHVAPRTGALVVLGAALDIANFCVWVMLITSFFARSSATRRLMVALLALGIAESVAPQMLLGTSAETRDVVSVVVLALWLPYVLRSERVRKTFASGPMPRSAIRAALVAFAVLSAAFVGLTLKSYRQFGSRSETFQEPADEFQAALEREPELVAWANSVEKDAIARGLTGAGKTSFVQNAGAELASKGLLRLPYEELRRRAVLILKMLDGADDDTCAKRGRAQITYAPLLPLMPVQDLREWNTIAKDAMVAEVRGSAPSVSVDDGAGIVAHYSAALPGPEQHQLEDSRKADAPAANACWAVRWMYRIGLAADGPKARPYVRWLAVQ